MSSRVAKQSLVEDEADDSNGSRTPLKISSRQISLVNSLAECRNMRLAAMAMHTTQPTVSLLLQQLESRLGVKLFERLSRGLEPTIYGDVLIRYARSVVHDFEHAQAEISELSKGASGFVRIGSVAGSVPLFLTRKLIAFKEESPRVRISVDVETSDTLIPKLLQGDLDLVLGRLPDHLGNRDLAIDHFDEGEQMSVIARPGHRLARKKSIRLTDLFELTWILHPIGSPMRLRIETALKKTRATSTLDIVETTSILLTTSMIQASDMISVVPRDVARHYADHGMVTILPVKLPVSMVNLGIITRKSKVLSPAVTRFLAHIRKN